MRGVPVQRRQQLLNGDDMISYDILEGPENPAVLYLPAFDTPKNDLKASIIERYCRNSGHTYISADWYGCGSSTGNFEDGTLSRWTEDTIYLLENVGKGKKTTLVGGGVGGWVALLVAVQRPDLVAGIVGLAADPDFTERLLWAQLPEETKDKIMKEGVADVPWGSMGTMYTISRALIEDGRKNLVLTGDPGRLPVTCPVRLVHGLRDEEVPHSVAIELSKRLASRDVVISLIKGGHHNLDDQRDFPVIRTAVRECVEAFFEFDIASTAAG